MTQIETSNTNCASDTFDNTQAKTQANTQNVEGVTGDIIALMNARAQVYRLMAQMYFKELDAASIELLRAGGLGAIETGNQTADAGLREMGAYLERAGRGARQELAVDFARCMLAAGSYEERRPTPYESVFTSETGLLMQEARDDAYRFYCEAHLGVNESLQTPEDHLAFELEFMAALAERAAASLESKLAPAALADVRTQAEFHAAHLENWIDAYTDCLSECAQTRFYRGLAAFTRGFIHEDRTMIAEALAELEN